MEKEFKLNIENIKSDLAIEGMGISHSGWKGRTGIYQRAVLYVA